jgi:regulator of nonsense transcripts 1
MIQFSKPRRSLNKSMEPFRRFETDARDFLGRSSTGPSGTPSRFDATFYRTHDAMGYIGADQTSQRAQAPYAAGLPMFPAGPYGGGGGGPGNNSARAGAKRGAYGGYAASIISQDHGGHGGGSVYGGPADTASVVGSALGGPAPSTSSIAYSQSDRLRRGRRGSGSSSWAGTSELGSVSGYDYKSTDDGADDDVKSQYTAQSQAGVTVY